MRAEQLRELCLSSPSSEQTFPFAPETSVFKVTAKMFALSRLSAEPLSVSLKCEPGLAEQLREAHAAVTPGYHLNKRHSVTAALDASLPDSMVRDMVEDSYDLVVSGLPKARRRAPRSSTFSARRGRRSRFCRISPKVCRESQEHT